MHRPRSDRDRETLAEARRQVEDQIERLKAEKAAVWGRLRGDHAELGRLAATSRPGDPRLADTHDRIREAERRVSEVDSELAVLAENNVDEGEVAAALADFNAVWDCLSSAEQARVIHLLVERVVYDGEDENISITFRPSGIRGLGGQLAGRKEEAALLRSSGRRSSLTRSSGGRVLRRRWGVCPA